MNRIRSLAVLILPILAASAAAPSSAAELTAHLEERSLAVSGVAPGADVALLSVWRERIRDVATRIVHLSELASDDDSDGAVRFELEEDPPTASVWVVVDVTSGESAILAPEGYPIRQIESEGRGIGRALGRLVVAREDLLVLAVRPGVGAWSLAISDGGREDDDGEPDGRASARLAALQPLGDSPPAPNGGFDPGDVVAVIDANTMSVAALRIDP